MFIYRALILGLIQGATEFLPISSSAHLIILPETVGWAVQPLFFDVMIHFGSALAILAYFHKELIIIIKEWRDWWLKILVGIAPAGVVGFLLRQWIESTLRTSSLIIIFLFLGSLLMLFAELYSSRKFFDSSRPASKKDSDSESISVSLKQALAVGIFQILALFSGFSRSGTTISGGLIFGLSREKAAKFSFLLSIPLLLGASFYELSTVFKSDLSFPPFSFVFAGSISSFFFSLISISFLIRFLKRNSLIPFVLYRIVLVLFLLFYIV